MRPSGSPGRPHGRWRCRVATSVTSLVKAIASFMGGQDGLAEGLAVGLATGEDWATETGPPAGTAARAGVKWKGPPALAPHPQTPPIGATLSVFIVARTK